MEEWTNSVGRIVILKAKKKKRKKEKRPDWQEDSSQIHGRNRICRGCRYSAENHELNVSFLMLEKGEKIRYDDFVLVHGDFVVEGSCEKAEEELSMGILKLEILNTKKSEAARLLKILVNSRR
ncbi:hypothetical protein V1477_004329 [Vespula maculifrons]|uniref:Uncharacterized protein n=1 Tax=Vespula maculifrons TaxID=7453 RepID=A0ABD2CRC4_VESMC